VAVLPVAPGAGGRLVDCGVVVHDELVVGVDKLLVTETGGHVNLERLPLVRKESSGLDRQPVDVLRRTGAERGDHNGCDVSGVTLCVGDAEH